MSDRPNTIKEAKDFAIQEWDRIAQVQIRRGNYVRGFGAWSAKQMAKAHAESWVGLGVDIASLGTGALVTKGLRGISSLQVLSRARAAAAGAKYLQQASNVAKVVVKGANAERIIAKSAVSVPRLVGASRASMAAAKAMPGAIKASVAWGSRTHPVGIVRRVGKFIHRQATYQSPQSTPKSAARTGAMRPAGTSGLAKASAPKAPAPRKIAQPVKTKHVLPKPSHAAKTFRRGPTVHRPVKVRQPTPIRQPPKIHRPPPIHRPAPVHRPMHFRR